jgi:uncharacterized membrane protein
MRAITRQFYAAALSALATYFLDPQQGRRRRALLRDQLSHAAAKAERAAGITWRDGQNRLQGLLSNARVHAFETAPDDAVLVERVRSQLGRVVSHPGAIEVRASGGRVTLEGAILEREREPLLRAVQAMAGVEEVVEALVCYAEPGDIPSLQGGRDRQQLAEWRQQNWSPAMRTIAGAGSLSLIGYGFRRKGILGLGAMAAGSALLLRAARNQPVRELPRSAIRGIDLQKTITVNAPIERAYEVLSHFENFPHFMRNIRNVEVRSGDRSRWTVAGPAGVNVQWEAETTAREPNRLLGWRTLAGSSVSHEGSIQLEEAEHGTTRITVRMRYRPPAGAIGHYVARVFRSDAGTELDEDLLRLKTLLETGRPARDAAARAAERRLQ